MHLEAQERRSGPRNGPQAERLPGWGRSYLAPWYLVVARERKTRRRVVFDVFMLYLGSGVAQTRAPRPIASVRGWTIDGVASRAASAMRRGQAHVEPEFLSTEELDSVRADMTGMMAQISTGAAGSGLGKVAALEGALSGAMAMPPLVAWLGS